MRKSFVYIIHGLFWLGNLLLLLMVMGILCYNTELEESRVFFYFKLIIGIVFVPGIFSFYSFYLFLFPKYLQKNKISQTIGFGLLCSFIASILGAVALYFLLEFVFSCHAESNYFGIGLMSFVALLYGIVALVIKGFITWYEEIKIKEELKEKNHRMELALVKSQLDPHFLFNTINNIDVLIMESSEEASSYLNRLSDIMRFMLFETKGDFILLSKEMEYISKYIELQKIRSSNAHYVQYEVIGNHGEKRIAPMIFIPFIENAFKHCTNKKIENAINIKIEIGEQEVILYCDNAYDKLRKKVNNSHGLGSELIKKRLELIYPQAHQLETREENDRYFVELKLQL